MNAARSYLFTFLLGVVTAVMGVALLPVLFFGRDAARRAAQLWSRIILRLLHIICGVDYRIECRENAPVGGALVAANHQSMWETVSLFALLPKPAVVFKKELLDVPVYGWWAAKSGGIPLDRKGGAKSIRMLRRETEERIANGEQVVVFPEGTRAAPGEVLPLQPGIAGMYLAANTPCYPVIHNSGWHWRNPGVMKTPGVITSKFLKPIPKGLARRPFMAALAEALGEARSLPADFVVSESVEAGT